MRQRAHDSVWLLLPLLVLASAAAMTEPRALRLVSGSPERDPVGIDVTAGTAVTTPPTGSPQIDARRGTGSLSADHPATRRKTVCIANVQLYERLAEILQLDPTSVSLTYCGILDLPTDDGDDAQDFPTADELPHPHPLCTYGENGGCSNDVDGGGDDALGRVTSAEFNHELYFPAFRTVRANGHDAHSDANNNNNEYLWWSAVEGGEEDGSAAVGWALDLLGPVETRAWPPHKSSSGADPAHSNFADGLSCRVRMCRNATSGV
jgi:hypothetical protein